MKKTKHIFAFAGLLRLFSIALLGLPVLALGDKTNVDMLVHGDFMLTMTSANADDKAVVANGTVAIDKGIIVAVGKQADISSLYSADQVIDGKSRILMPGLVNGHTHSAMALFRGLADDMELMTWLTKYIFPMESRFVDQKFVEVGMRLACWEMIRGGTTTFADMYFYPQVAAAVVEACGLRAIIGSPSIDYPSPGFKGWDDSFASAIDFVSRGRGKSATITPAFAPHAPYTVSPAHLMQVAKAAKRLNALVLTHVAESPEELLAMQKQYQQTSVKHIQKAGLLETRLVAAHMVVPTAEEISLLAQYKVGVIHNPTSNLKTGAGISPVPKLLAAGVHVGLGTDGAASNNDLNMWDEIRLAALLHKGVANDATAMPTRAVLKMATIGGATAIGLGSQTGSLEAGKRADLIQVSIDRPGLMPVYDVESILVYAVQASDVVTTIVQGKVLMADRQVLTIDRERLGQQVEMVTAKIRSAL